jgi:hypothetical protein
MGENLPVFQCCPGIRLAPVITFASVVATICAICGTLIASAIWDDPESSTAIDWLAPVTFYGIAISLWGACLYWEYWT